jgi:Glycine zipper
MHSTCTRSWKSSAGRLGAGILLLALAGLAGCNDAESGALLGAGAGAGLGAIIGHQSGHGGEGAAIGAGGGALLGYIIGNESDKQKAQTQRRQYDNRDY